MSTPPPLPLTPLWHLNCGLDAGVGALVAEVSGADSGSVVLQQVETPVFVIDVK